ncbi:MAG TPA: DUF1214 domain-containing protein [Panacibacter sp.]|nr:DUF1214 domain-containing protein [Panacibacter sp.]
MKKFQQFIFCISAVALASCGNNTTTATDTSKDSATLTNSEVTNLVTEAYVQTFPIVENYKAIYFYAVLKQSPKYMPFNTVKNEAVLYTPADKAVVRANNDTYYSTAILDLRAEPVIFQVPEEKSRYYTFQLIGMTTDNFGYIGTRATGTKAGIYAITSPNFTGSLPAGVVQIKSPSDFVTVAGRTAVSSPEDGLKAIALQKKYKVGKMSDFYPDFKPKAVQEINWPAFNPADDNVADTFFSRFNLLAQYNKFSEKEQAIIDNYKQIGLVPGAPYTFSKDHPEYKDAIEEGFKIGQARVDSLSKNIGKKVNGWNMSPLMNDYFGDDYLLRAAWARKGIYLNSPVEAYYPATTIDGDGELLDGNNNYAITFPADALPPANYFWSLTMYDGITGLMVDNDLKRYSISDRTKGIVYNKDKSLTLYFGYAQPKEGKSNWLPAPKGVFDLLMRLYGPKENVLNGTYAIPKVEKLK